MLIVKTCAFIAHIKNKFLYMRLERNFNEFGRIAFISMLNSIINSFSNCD